ncbi:MAG: hypothetical protein OHK0015_04280 [Chloroflexi bacterium OHK40]
MAPARELTSKVDGRGGFTNPALLVCQGNRVNPLAAVHLFHVERLSAKPLPAHTILPRRQQQQEHAPGRACQNKHRERACASYAQGMTAQHRRNAPNSTTPQSSGGGLPRHRSTTRLMPRLALPIESIEVR